MDEMKLLQCAPLFRGVKPEEIREMLPCLGAHRRMYQKGAFIFQRGQHTSEIGLVLSGAVHILRDDFWGNRTILGRADIGNLFAEAYACVEGENIDVSVMAVAPTEILFLNAAKMLHTCTVSCPFHNRLIENLVGVLAQKNLMLAQKIEHMSKRTTQAKLLSYLSAESLRQGSAEFDIPYNRQQLAEFLSVDRSAMSGELSKLQRAGVLRYHKNHFELLRTEEL